MTSDARVERERNIVGWIRVTPSSVTERARAIGRRCARAAWREDDDALGVYGGDDATSASGRGARGGENGGDTCASVRLGAWTSTAREGDASEDARETHSFIHSFAFEPVSSRETDLAARLDAGAWTMDESATTGERPIAVDGASYVHRPARTSRSTSGSERLTSGRAPANASLLVAFGGGTRDGGLTNDVHAMDTKTKEWVKLRTTGDAPSKRMGHAATLSKDGRVFVHGGVGKNADGDDEYLADAYELNLGTLTWSKVPMRGSAPTPRAFHTINAMSTMMVCFGGDDGEQFLRQTYYMPYSDASWREPEMAGVGGKGKAGVMWPSERACHSATTLDDEDTLIIFGGLGTSSVSMNDCWAWSAGELCWSPIETPSQEPEARFLHAATVIGDGLFVAGGMTLNSKGVDSGKTHRTFDHVHILTGMHLLTHPSRRLRALSASPELNAQLGRRKSFSKEFPDKLHPKKKLAIAQHAKQLRATAEAKKAETKTAKEAVPEKKETAPTDADGKARAKAVSTAVESSIPGQKPTPPDDEDEDKDVEPQAKQAPTKDPEIPIPGVTLAPPDDEDEDDEPRAKQAPTKNAEIPIPGVKLAPPDDEDDDDEKAEEFKVQTVTKRTEIPIPGVRLAPPDDEDKDDEWHKNSTSKKTPSVPIVERSPEANANDDGVPGKSTPPVEESPTPKSKSKAVPVPGVCLAPDDDEDWDVDDIYQRMPSIQTSSEHGVNDDDDAQQSVPYEWVMSDDEKFSIMRERASGKILRKIPIPEDVVATLPKRKRAHAERQPSAAPKTPPTTTTTKPLPEVSTPVAAARVEYSDHDHKVAKKLFETLEVTKFPERYEALDDKKRVASIDDAWCALSNKERNEWLEMTHGPPSSRKRRAIESLERSEEDADDARRVSAAHLTMCARSETAHAAGIGDFRGANTALLGEPVTGVVTGGFDAGYFATVRLGGADEPTNYRAVLFSPVLCSQRLLPNAHGETRPTLVLPSYCDPKAPTSVVRDVVFGAPASEADDDRRRRRRAPSPDAASDPPTPPSPEEKVD